MVDTVDELILSALSRNSKQDTIEIWDLLRDRGYSLTEEEIESKLPNFKMKENKELYNISRYKKT